MLVESARSNAKMIKDRPKRLNGAFNVGMFRYYQLSSLMLFLHDCCLSLNSSSSPSNLPIFKKWSSGQPLRCILPVDFLAVTLFCRNGKKLSGSWQLVVEGSFNRMSWLTMLLSAPWPSVGGSSLSWSFWNWSWMCGQTWSHTMQSSMHVLRVRTGKELYASWWLLRKHLYSVTSSS